MDSGAPQSRSPWESTIGQPQARSRRWLWLPIMGGLVISALLLNRLYASRNQSVRVATAPRPAMPVAAVEVRRGDLNRYLSAIGTVTAFNTVTLRTRVDGQIVNIAFKEGQLVHQGALLLEIDPRPYRAALGQAEGLLAKDEATLVNAKVALARDQKLYQEGVIAAQDLDNQRSVEGQSEGAVKSDAANVAAAKVQLAYTRITAPITGRIGLRIVDLGNIVHAADTTGLAVITQLQPIAVTFSIPEDNLPQVMNEIRSGKELPVQAYDRESKTQLASGMLETFDSQIDQTTGTIKLKSIFANNDYSLFPNQFVNVKLLVDTRRDVLLVPAAALQRTPQGTFVYVVKPDHTIEVRTVAAGAGQGELVALDSGLAPGELLVTDGLDRLQAGMKVNVQMAANAGAAGSGQ